MTREIIGPPRRFFPLRVLYGFSSALPGRPAYGASFSPTHQSAAPASHGVDQTRDHSASISHDFGSWLTGQKSTSGASGARTAIEADRGLSGAVSAALDDV